MHTKDSETPMEESGVNQVAAATAEKSSEIKERYIAPEKHQQILDKRRLIMTTDDVNRKATKFLLSKSDLKRIIKKS